MRWGVDTRPTLVEIRRTLVEMGDNILQFPIVNFRWTLVLGLSFHPCKFETFSLRFGELGICAGAHTFGKAHCTEVARRFYGFNSTTGMDPTLSAKYGEMLRSLCPLPLSPTATVPLDPVTPNVFDKVYYTDLLEGRGLMSSDAGLAADPQTAPLVLQYSHSKAVFFEQFATSMIKLGRVGMPLGSEGQVRRNCSAVNWARLVH